MTSGQEWVETLFRELTSHEGFEAVIDGWQDESPTEIYCRAVVDNRQYLIRFRHDAVRDCHSETAAQLYIRDCLEEFIDSLRVNDSRKLA